MITKTTRKATPATGATRSITAGTSITSGIRNRTAQPAGTNMQGLTASQQAFVRQLRSNIRRNTTGITAATNTSNIMARPDFLELLPMFVQKLLLLDVFGSVAMNSRQQLIPYFKVVAENTKGETHAGDVLSSPFVNRQGVDPNFTSRFIKNEIVTEANVTEDTEIGLAYLPVLPNSVTLTVTAGDVVTKYVDDGAGNFLKDGSKIGFFINYSTGQLFGLNGASRVVATYQYDNETVGPHVESNLAHGQYGAYMGKTYLELDEINLVAEAHELASYWSIYSAFAAQREYGANIGEISKEAAFSELTAEINSYGFQKLEQAAMYKPQFNWDAAPVLSGSVVPSDYLNMFKLKLNQAAASIYQATRLTRPNRLIVGSNVAAYIAMIDSFRADNVDDSVGPYKLGSLDQFEVYVAPDYDPNKWVMACKSNDIRRNSALFGEYMPIMSTDAIGLANMSVQQGYASMYAMNIVNPATIASGRILGVF